MSWRLERICIDLRFRARREIERRLTDDLSPVQRRQLDALTQHRAESGQSWLGWLGWLRQPQATKPAAMLGLIERLNHVRAIGIDAARGHRVHQTRLAQLAREAGRTTAQHIAGYKRQRRYTTLVAITLDLGPALTDQAIDLFERLIGTMFSKAETRHARAFQAAGRAINEKVRLYARVGAALIAAREAGQDPFEAITAVIPWERFRASVAEAETLARPEDFDSYEGLGEHYAAMRRWAPAFLAAFSFQGGPAAASLLRAVDTLRDMNEAASSKLPKSAPTGFIRERWARYVMPGGELTGVITSSASCRSCAVGCAPETSGSSAVAATAPSKSISSPAKRTRRCCKAALCRLRSIPISSVSSLAAAPVSMRVCGRLTPRRQAACCPMSRSRRGC
jgi:hypothetical protein